MRRAGIAALLAASLLWVGCSDTVTGPVNPQAEAITDRPVASAQPSAEAAQLAARVAALEATVALLQTRGATSTMAVPTTPPVRQDAARHTARHTAQEPLPDDRQPGARAAQLQAEFMAEAADPRWASSAQAGIRGALREVGPAGLNAQVDCRSRSCRVVVAAAPADGEVWLQRLALQLAPSFGTVRTLGSDGTGSTVLYLSP